uniref:Golgi-associated plant pathogenesis-related protein 1 n=1 Tax=Hucho hucho TaxID=62062 RepID=A0A4W5LIA9_9TELE
MALFKVASDTLFHPIIIITGSCITGSCSVHLSMDCSSETRVLKPRHVFLTHLYIMLCDNLYPLSSLCIGKDVADRWYDEVKQYNFNRPGFSSGTGHFTAMVWKGSKKLGVGKASAPDGSSFVVARYFPAGNITNQGHFDNNVLPPKD